MIHPDGPEMNEEIFFGSEAILRFFALGFLLVGKHYAWLRIVN